MRLSTKLFITIIALLIALILLLAIFVQTSQEQFVLPPEGAQNFSIDLKRGWHYELEVITWSGDEIINVSIMRGEEMIYSVLLEGEKLEYGEDPEVVIYPRLGEFQVEETEKCELVVLVISEGTQGSTKLQLIGTSQEVLGFDVLFLAVPIFIALVCACVALFLAVFYELFQTIRTKEKIIIEPEKPDERTFMQQCFYHKEQAINQCEKCKRYICSDCTRVFHYPFSGTLLVFAEDFEGSKQNLCPLCYWKSVHEIASSWSLRISHLFALIILVIILIQFNLTFIQPITAQFSTPLNTADWVLLGFLMIFTLSLIGFVLLVLYSLLIDAPRRASKAKISHQEFLVETGLREDNLSYEMGGNELNAL